MKPNNIIEGTPEWEQICECCGICCLLKYCDELGNIYLTNVRCASLDKNTRECKCYAADMNSRDNGCENCIALGGTRVTRETLNNDYPVPSFCPYVKMFCRGTVAKRAQNRPIIDWENTISETEMLPGDLLANHIIPGSNKFFKHLPHVNKMYHDFKKIVSR